MPSKSEAQARLMAGVAHDPKFAKKVGIPQAVGKEFNEADQAKSKGRTASRISKLYKDSK